MKQRKIPQVHGGALLPGGAPGNKGGGRTPDVLRFESREVFGLWLDQAKQRLQRPETLDDKVWVQIGRTAGERGVPSQKEVTVEDVRNRIRATAVLLQSSLPTELWESIVPRLKEIWDA